LLLKKLYDNIIFGVNMLKNVLLKAIKRKNGFTLIELIVVIAVLGILAAILIPTVTNIIGKATNNTYKANAKEAFETAQYITVSRATAGIANTTITQTDLAPYLGGTFTGTVSITMSSGDVATATYTNNGTSAVYP
jgi:prepilin-type N-terminal cleavage/methylation domain-containing protein